ncbi:hypothetical protein IF2G_06717 [Cordyceps javanica]|nr:hypothetical protein IF2G_06717 [Cordyceps javanica]
MAVASIRPFYRSRPQEYFRAAPKLLAAGSVPARGSQNYQAGVNHPLRAISVAGRVQYGAWAPCDTDNFHFSIEPCMFGFGHRRLAVPLPGTPRTNCSASILLEVRVPAGDWTCRSQRHNAQQLCICHNQFFFAPPQKLACCIDEHGHGSPAIGRLSNIP